MLISLLIIPILGVLALSPILEKSSDSKWSSDPEYKKYKKLYFTVDTNNFELRKLLEPFKRKYNKDILYKGVEITDVRIFIKVCLLIKRLLSWIRGRTSFYRRWNSKTRYVKRLRRNSEKP